MRNRFFLTAAAFALATFGAATTSMAQSDILLPGEEGGILIGPMGGINAVSYTSDEFATTNEPTSCFSAQNGSGIAPWGGLTLEIPLGDAMQNFIVGEVLYDSKSSPFQAKNGSIPTRPTKINGVEAEGSVNTKVTADLAYLLFNLAYKYNFTNGPRPVGFGIQVGPSVGLKLTTTLNKTVDVTFSSGNPEAPQGSDTKTDPQDVSNAQSIRIAVRGQVGYDIPLTDAWIATPVAGYDFPFTKVDSDRNWGASSLYTGVAIRYFLNM